MVPLGDLIVIWIYSEPVTDTSVKIALELGLLKVIEKEESMFGPQEPAEHIFI